MTISEPWTPTPGKGASLDSDLEDAIREYLRTYVMWRGIRQATATFGVSRHTLWRFLRRGHTGRALPRAVLGIVGDSVEVLEAATWAIAAADRVLASRPAAKPVLSPYPLSQALEDTLLLLCAAPLATVDELSRFGRIPASTLRDRLKKLVKMGMADSVSHRLTILGPHPHLRYFPTEKGIHAGAMVEWGAETFLREYPVSRQWFRLLAERLDSVAALYRAAALVLQRRFKEGCAGRHEVRRGAWHGSAWPVRYYPASLPATAATQPARTVPWAAIPAPPGRPAAS